MDNGLLLRKAYDKLKASDLPSACSHMEQALDLDFENEEIKHALKCVHWWLEHTRRIDDINNPFEKGSLYISLFKQYHVFLEQLDDVYDQCQYAIRFFVFSRALFFFEGLLSSHSNDPGLLLLIGRCYKGLGNYDEAIRLLEQAVRIKREDAEILAEVADVNALLAQTKAAKALFREAFFIDPSKIDLRSLESALILKLVSEVSVLCNKEDEINEWIPVYGYIWGVFSVKRELKQMEAGRLKQSIFSLETEYEKNPSRRRLVKPRLLNHYFWLIDHYEISREDPSLIEETLLKIKVADPDTETVVTQTGENTGSAASEHSALAQSLLKNLQETLNEEKWTRATLGNYSTSQFKELDDILKNARAEKVLDELKKNCDEHLSHTRNSIIALYLSGMVALSRQILTILP
jgi:tetratricopeptide (TPR) repeat protein